MTKTFKVVTARDVMELKEKLFPASLYGTGDFETAWHFYMGYRGATEIDEQESIVTTISTQIFCTEYRFLVVSIDKDIAFVVDDVDELKKLVLKLDIDYIKKGV